MDTLERRTDIPGPPDRPDRRRRLLIAAAAAIALIVAIGVAIALAGSDEENPPVLNTTTTVAATTSTTATTVPEPVGVETSYELFADQPVACGAEQPPAPANLTYAAPRIRRSHKTQRSLRW